MSEDMSGYEAIVVPISEYNAMREENASLKAQVKRLRVLDSLKTISLSDSPTWNAIGAYADVKEENARLKAEVERLTKAGDAMAEIIKPPSDCDTWIDETIAFKAWCNAKGVQS